MITESTVEDAALAWLEALGYTAIAAGELATAYSHTGRRS